MAYHDPDDIKDPRVSVLLSKSFDGLPPCLFIVAELDPIRDESYGRSKKLRKDENTILSSAYKEALDKAGVRTKLVLINGVIHPFFSYPGKKHERVVTYSYYLFAY